MWISSQKKAFKKHKMSEERIEMLKKITMDFEIEKNDKEWFKRYELAKAYYGHHGNLDIKINFKTKNGYEYDENGIALGTWIDTQKRAFKKHKMSEERIEMLKKITMDFEIEKNDKNWFKKYELAKAYYEHHGNLEMPQSFKTLNGYEYDENGINLGMWISSQKQAFKKYKLQEDKTEMLDKIKMKYFSKKQDEKLQKEIINEKNTDRKQIELYNRFLLLLNNYDNESLPQQEEINQSFINELDVPKKK